MWHLDCEWTVLPQSWQVWELGFSVALRTSHHPSANHLNARMIFENFPLGESYHGVLVDCYAGCRYEYEYGLFYVYVNRQRCYLCGKMLQLSMLQLLITWRNGRDMNVFFKVKDRVCCWLYYLATSLEDALVYYQIAGAAVARDDPGAWQPLARHLAECISAWYFLHSGNSPAPGGTLPILLQQAKFHSISSSLVWLSIPRRSSIETI